MFRVCSTQNRAFCSWKSCASRATISPFCVPLRRGVHASMRLLKKQVLAIAQLRLVTWIFFSRCVWHTGVSQPLRANLKKARGAYTISRTFSCGFGFAMCTHIKMRLILVWRMEFSSSACVPPSNSSLVTHLRRLHDLMLLAWLGRESCRFYQNGLEIGGIKITKLMLLQSVRAKERCLSENANGQ